VYGAIRIASAQRSVRTKLRALAAAQGFIGFVDDIEFAIAGQYSYRIIGQILFYFAFRRKQPRLKVLHIDPSESLPGAFRKFWDDVRRYDYEALFAPHELDSLVAIPKNEQHLLGQFYTPRPVADILTGFALSMTNILDGDIAFGGQVC
jgi:hypothetical protein